MYLQKAIRSESLRDSSEWKPVKGFEADYAVHFRGVIKNIVTGVFLKPGRAKAGYLTVSLYKDKKGNTKTLHRLVAEAFVSGTGECVNHIDGNKQNNHFSNLEFVSFSENNSHAIRTGLKKSFNEARGVIQMDLNGNEIARYRTSEDVPNPFSGGCVCLVCNGKRSTHQGFKWKWQQPNKK